MATRSLDVALRIATDLDGAVKDVNALDKSLDGLKGGGQNAAQGLNAAATAATKNSTANQGNATSAKAAGVAQTALGAATQKTAGIQQRAALTAGELRNAQRQLPAQITDIVTSLASGQSVFMVAIQQGGQLKDSWGGIVPAGRALLGALNPVVLGVTAGAAAFGAIALAGIQFAQERQAITQALLQTGNYAGASVQEVEALADAIASLDGVTASGARDALLQTAQSGRFAGEQFEMVATIAARMEAATGQAIDTTIQKFAEISKDPVQALLKLNETEHFLTAEHLARLQALVSLGLEQDAAAEGARIYAERLDEIATAADAAQPHLSRLWREMKEGASEVWEETKQFAEFLAAAGEQYSNMPWWQRIGPAAGINSIRALYGAQPAAPPLLAPVAGTVNSKDQAARDAEEKKRQGERKAFMDAETRYLSDAAKKQAERAGVEDLLNRRIITREEATKRLARIEESYARKGTRKSGGKSEAQQDQEAAARELANLEKQIALTATLANGERQISNEARVAYEIKAGAYRLSSATTQQELLAAAKRRDAQLAEIEAEQKRKQETEKTLRQYEQLRQELQTPIEAAIEDVTSKIKVLNDMLAAGEKIAGGYDAALQRIFDQSFTKAPEFRSPYEGQDDVTGLLGEKAGLDAYKNSLDKWREEELKKADAFRATNVMKESDYQKRLEEVKGQYAQRTTGLIQAQHQLQLNATQSIFDSMASIMYHAAGEQSKAYRVMFALSKGLAIAQAAVNLARAISEASAQPWPMNLPAIASAVAQGANIASMIASLSYSPQGYATGGRIVGPGTPTSDSVPIWASRDEHMIRAASATQPGARAFLNDFNEYGMLALHKWGNVGRFAEGGPIMPNELAEPAMRMATPSASPVNLQNEMTIFVAAPGESLVDYVVNHPKHKRSIVIESIDNQQAIRMGWGGGS